MNELLPLKNKTLRKLNALRYKHENKAAEHAHMQHQRKQADAPDASLQKAWFRSMFLVLEEIDQVLRCVPSRVPIRFLDLGCCPGGFSSYILGKNPHASGVGVSLPEERGGHACLLDEEQLSRFQLHWADLTQYQLGPTFIDDLRLQDFPVSPGFDIVLIDGHPLRACDSARGGHDNLYMHGDRLLISQVLIGLLCVGLGGTVILKQSKPERIITSQMMFLLDILCLDVRTWKPVCMHSTRATFYVIAKGFGLGAHGFRRREILEGLMDLWVQLSYTDGTGRKLRANDLDFIVDQETLKTVYAPRLRELSEHIWTTQSKCLEGWREAQAEGF
ncbi:hypothetical protein FB45DRAFT_824435 [Roridomyces roridus]|uniref:Ribosomal RNA methyltransferase FtsJ domain-containing protein n=1 Tax=Roridomyces roridus TaxID=1738132 RepID=A0AAD7FUR7_9AGAR|nr:hypothetical protein FB45DRAFT_824435 [Roridomyces roridus]